MIESNIKLLLLSIFGLIIIIAFVMACIVACDSCVLSLEDENSKNDNWWEDEE